MADLWQQFHGLPKAIRDGVATPTAIAAVDELERQYPGVELASFVMRTVVREFPVADLPAKISSECSIDIGLAATMAERLRRDVFTGLVADYLGLAKPSAPTAPSTSSKTSPTIPLPSVAPTGAPSNLPIVASVPSIQIPKVAKPAQVTSPTIPPAVVPVQPPTAPIIPQPQSPVGFTAPTTQYSDDDAAEIAHQASKLRSLTTVNPNQDLDSLANQILLEQNLASSDELLQRRSVSILKSRLKDVRTTDEVVAMFTRDPKVGGLGLDRELALTLAAAAERYAATLKGRGMIRTPEQPAPPPIPVIPAVTQQRPAPLPPLRREAAMTTPVALQNFTEAARPSRPIRRPSDMPVIAPLKIPITPIAQSKISTAPVIQRPRGADRPTVADVVRPQIAMGPAEELRSMTLIEFRRLGQGAGDAARKLLDKFQHLQRESFAVWAEAISGWRQSSIYQLYITMGRESMEKGQPISQIIADRGQTGQPYLSEHEFTVLSDLNRQLQL